MTADMAALSSRWPGLNGTGGSSALITIVVASIISPISACASVFGPKPSYLRPSVQHVLLPASPAP
ncbi:hypothetical protein BDW71DRAFT_190683 [Aspergillus fruticulosus]